MKLELWLKHNEMSSAEFADNIGVARSTIRRIIKGERKPGLDLVMKIERATKTAVVASDLVTS